MAEVNQAFEHLKSGKARYRIVLNNERVVGPVVPGSSGGVPAGRLCIMTKMEVMALLRAHRNERGIAHWNKPGVETGGLKSFGIGLTQLRKLAKRVGRDHRLAQSLWKHLTNDRMREKLGD